MHIQKKQWLGSLLGQATVILVLVFLFACGGTLTYLRTGGFSVHVGVIPLVAGLCLLAVLVLGRPFPQKAGKRRIDLL